MIPDQGEPVSPPVPPDLRQKFADTTIEQWTLLRSTKTGKVVRMVRVG